MLYWKSFLLAGITVGIMGCHHSNPQAAYYNAQLGLLYAQEGAYAKARINAFKAIEFDPHSAYAHYAVAYYAQRTNQKLLAQQHYLTALDLNPASGLVNDRYALFLCEQGQYSQAFMHFNKASEDVTYAKISEIYAHAGHCALKIPNSALAEQYFNKAQDHKSGS